MMSLWKLRVGVESYYLAQVASGLDEYYTGAGEAAGRWTGSGSALLGLVDDVAGEELRAVLAGLAPGTGLTPNGTRLKSHPRRVPGFDLTFAVPKSVSVLYALGDPLVQAAVIEACEAAVAESLAWLEREACFVRRGTNSAKLATDPTVCGTRRMVAEGFVAAQFLHRTSRLGDPHLHWHVLVANMARGIDGRWTALDGQALYRAQRTVGVLFQTAMRCQLTDRLGVEWGPTHNDSADIAGVPSRVLREFSQRTERIAEWMERHGVAGAAAKNEALLETRPTKQTPIDFARVEASWRERAERLGWGPTELDKLRATTPATVDTVECWVIPDDTWSPAARPPITREVSFEEWLEWLVTARVTEKSGTFTRFDLTQAVGAVFPTATSLTSVEPVVSRALASPVIVEVGDHWTQRRPMYAPDRTVADDRELRYTSGSLLAVERRLLHQLHTGTSSRIGILDPDAVKTASAASTLGPDQRVAVLALTSAGDRVAVMVGRAGAGKTHTLGTLRSVYEAVGWDVIGLAPSARAARELQEGAGIGSTTIARHLVEHRTITSTTLVVIDEAAMTGTRDLAAIVDQATAAGAKMVLVGDHHQLPEVAAGGAFRAVLDQLGDRVVELTVNRRQQHAWEQAALDQLRCGDVATAFNAYRDHGRVVIADTPDDLHAIVLRDWRDTRPHGATLLLAGTRAEARLLNRHARRMLAETGELDLTDEISFAGRGFVAGDKVVMGHNHRYQHLTTGEPFAVDNGMRGTVTDLSLDHMGIRITSGEHLVLDRDYLEHGWVDHAYAVTIHKAQGVTCDSVLVVGPAGLYREGAYVALSRARHEARLYVTVDQAAGIEERHQRGIPLPTEGEPDPAADLLARLQRSAAKNLATVDDPHADTVAELVSSTPAPELLALARHAAETERTCGADDPSDIRAELEAAIATRTHVDVGRRIRAIDRDNVGCVLSIDDAAGDCTVQFDSVDGRTAVKTFDWSQLVVIDHPDEVELPTAAAGTLNHRTDIVVEAEHTWAAALATHGVAPGDADLYRRAVHTAADAAARALHADPPEWLTIWLGQRPVTAAATSVWDDAVARIAHYRALHETPANEPGIGTRPDDPIDGERWNDLMVRLLEDRLWLADHPVAEPAPLPTLTPTELAERHHELDELLATAPADQREFIDRIAHSQLDPTEMHEYLSAAMAIQDDRRQWILTNWPHLVELEQITSLIAEQEPLAHWPTVQPDAARAVLEQLRQLAPELDTREDRTLAELDRQEIENDPVRQLEARRAQLHRAAERAVNAAERDAVQTELDNTGRQLRKARRERTVDDAFGRYATSPIDQTRATRITTLTHDTLTIQPTWLVDHIRELHDADQLNAYDVADLATRITLAATHLDRHGDLPNGWHLPTPSVVEVAPPPLEVG